MVRIAACLAVSSLFLACGDGRGDAAADDSGIDLPTAGGTAGDTSGADTDDSGDGSSESNGGEIFDVLPEGDLPGNNGGDCGGGGGQGGEGFDFSFIWIANSPEGTVSKIDTVTAVEVARYRTGPGAPDPSRTSVNLEGDVAVLNRAGSVTKIAARLEDCVDADGNGTIETSSGPADILPWGEDECVLWHTPLDYIGGGGPRSIAWDAGDPDASCKGAGSHVWVGFRNDPDDGEIRELEGATGNVIESVNVPAWLQVFAQGLYGGAMDGAGNFWVIGKGGSLLRLDTQTLAQDRWEQPPPANSQETFYGFAVNEDGAPWIAGQSGHLYRFDPVAETFEVVADLGLDYQGMAIDRDGFAWMAYRSSSMNLNCGVTKFDTATKTLVTHLDLPGCVEPVGVSIDVEGFVWVVDKGANQAYKVDPDVLTSVTVGGLVSPYTYSDMTGAGLDLVVNPPTG